jgi:hypothetical protein
MAAMPDLSGLWELRYDSKSVPQATLTPLAQRTARANLRNDVEGLRWCRIVGMPLQMDGPLDIQQGRIEVALISPMNAVARHLYVDGRKRLDMQDYDPTTVGNSTAHWDGDVLVVDTVGFSDRGVVAIPGGGYRSSGSHMTERYRLLADGQQMSVTFTWTDPKVFVLPHTYTYRYYRLPMGATVAAWTCDPNDEQRAQFFAPAVQSLQ